MLHAFGTLSMPQAILVEVVVLIALTVLGVSVRQWIWNAGYKAGKASNVDRRREKLVITQRNIAGRIRKAIQETIPSNLQWGYRLLSTQNIGDENSTICVFDSGVASADPVLKINVEMDPSRNVVWVSIPSSQIYVTGPNAPELTRFISRQLDFIQNWSPAVFMVAPGVPYPNRPQSS